ncbi:MAG: NAD(+)/NADH kinase [Nanoarchaeota archaeon]|nr:NAD(+)/NADH kinase [Nanoarchaeota archaeon]
MNTKNQKNNKFKNSPYLKKVLVVYKKSVFELYEKSSDKPVVKFIKNNDEDAIRIRKSDAIQKKTLKKVISSLEKYSINHDIVYRGDLEQTRNIDSYSIIISVGGDGTLIEVSHYVNSSNNIPILGINSDPSPHGSTGFYCCCDADKFEGFLEKIDEQKISEIGRMSLQINKTLLPEQVLNDILLAHTNPAAISRYRIGEKNYKGSGMLICTPAGSTGFMREEQGEIMDLNSKMFQYILRSKRNAKPEFAEKIKITSLTRQGKIFVDGQHLIYDFSIGNNLEISKGNSIKIFGDIEKKRAKYYIS